MVYTQKINFALMTFRLENLKEGEHLEDSLEWEKYIKIRVKEIYMKVWTVF
jgi:hypothetical protein